jgi:acyl dehydratase
MATCVESASAWPLATLAEHVGDIVGPSNTVVVDQARIDAFADATEDRQWIHTDVEGSAGSLFGGTIAHGFLTLSLLSHFMEELITVSGTAMAINYGLDRVRFAAPVPAGSALRATIEILKVEPGPDRVMMKAKVTMTVDGAERPSCVAESVTLFRPTAEETA